MEIKGPEFLGGETISEYLARRSLEKKQQPGESKAEHERRMSDEIKEAVADDSHCSFG